MPTFSGFAPLIENFKIRDGAPAHFIKWLPLARPAGLVEDAPADPRQDSTVLRGPRRIILRGTVIR